MDESNDDVTVGVGPTPGCAVDRTESLAQGDSVGRYVVLSMVGSGGMGSVYAAYDPELDRRVALKLLHGRKKSDHNTDGRTRLQREAQAIARLDHPNVITVHDVGEHDGRVFIAMEFVEGETLRLFMQDKTRPWRDLLEVFVQAGRGLEAAHEAGLVHRDFKPDNVLVDRRGRARVLDFGLASAADSKSSDDFERSIPPSLPPLDARLTVTGAVMGTPAYMSPEQHRGQATDARTDQFSFCVTLWEGLFRQRPFSAETLASLAGAVLAGDVQDPRADNIPISIERILRRGLSVKPEDRWPTMGELLAALDAAAQPRRRRVWVVPAVIAGLVTMGGVYVATDKSEEPCAPIEDALDGIWDDEREEALVAVFEASSLPYAESLQASAVSRLDRYATTWLETARSNCEATRVRGEQSAEAFDLRSRCLDRRRRAMDMLVAELTASDETAIAEYSGSIAALPDLETCSDIPNLRMAMPATRDEAAESRVRELVDAANIDSDLGRIDRARDKAAEALEIALQIDHKPLQAEAHLAYGGALEAEGEYAASAEAFAHGVWAAYASGHEHAVVAGAADIVRIVALRLAQPERAQIWAGFGLAGLTRAGGESARAPMLLSNVGVLELMQGHDDDAQAHFDAAIAAHVAQGGTPEGAAIYYANNAANVLFERGEYQRAAEKYNAAFVALRRSSGDTHPQVAVVLHNLGNCAAQLGDNKKGIEYLRQAYAIRTQLFGDEHPTTANTLSSLGVLLGRTDQLDKAVSTLERAAAALEAGDASSGPALGAAYANLADVVRRQGDLDRAASLFDRARAQFEASVGADHPYLAYPLSGHGIIALQRGDAPQATKLLERALAINGDSHTDPELLGLTRFALARALRVQNLEPARAAELAAQAREDFTELDQTKQVREVEKFLAATN